MNLSNFSIDAIREELERIKNHKAKVDSDYQRKMMQLKSPDPNSVKYRRQKSGSTIQKRDMASSISAVKYKECDDADGSASSGEVTGFQSSSEVATDTTPFSNLSV